LQNNLDLQNSKRWTNYAQQMKKTSADIQPLDVVFEYGQFNSIYADNKVSLSQNLQFPTVYARNKKLLESEYKHSLLNVTSKENELTKQVRLLFNELLLFGHKKAILGTVNQDFSTVIEKVNLRFSKGEIDALEKTSVEIQQAQLQLQLQNLNNDYEILVMQFNWLLNTSRTYIPAEDNKEINSFKMPLELTWSDTAALQQNVALQTLQQELNTRQAQINVEKAKLLPNLNLGYNSMTIRGIGSDDKYYSTSKRFQSVMLGIGLPIWSGAQKNRIKAANISLQIAQNTYQNERKKMFVKWRSLQKSYENQQSVVAFYENNTYAKSKKLSSLVMEKAKRGEINLLEMLMLNNQYINVHIEYLQAIAQQNINIIEIQSLLNK
jgi:cobalt-zinc-cadmium resistance protein CzcA